MVKAHCWWAYALYYFLPIVTLWRFVFHFLITVEKFSFHVFPSFLPYLLHSHHIWCPFTFFTLKWLQSSSPIALLAFTPSMWGTLFIFLFLSLSHVQMVAPSSCYFHTSSFLLPYFLPSDKSVAAGWPLPYCLQMCFLLEMSLSCFIQWLKSPLLQDYQPFQGFGDILWSESSWQLSTTQKRWEKTCVG